MYFILDKLVKSMTAKCGLLNGNMNGVKALFSLSEMASQLATIYLIAVLGYAVGRIQIKQISLGTAGIFLVGLLFGHLGVELPGALQTMGLTLFITAVGFSAGPGFLQRLKKNGLQYIVLCLSSAIIGAVICVIIVRTGALDAPLAVGVMTGAFTTSPGFAAAKEAAGAAQAAQVAAGYGMIYPVGVVCKVIFIQMIPRLLHADLDYERSLIAMPKEAEQTKAASHCFRIDKLGVSAFSLAAGLGILLGAVVIPLPNAGRFALGTTGGPLVLGVLFGGLKSVGCLDLRVDKTILTAAKELGLLMFFAGAGVEGGHGIGSVLAEYGLTPLLYGFIFVVIPLFSGFAISRYILRLPMLNGLGAMTASMTCTPSLAILTQMAQTDDVVAAYATTYPIALITLVTIVQFLIRL